MEISDETTNPRLSDEGAESTSKLVSIKPLQIVIAENSKELLRQREDLLRFAKGDGEDFSKEDDVGFALKEHLKGLKNVGDDLGIVSLRFVELAESLEQRRDQA